VFLILGLGNPGLRYELTRHNAGFLVLDNLADKYKIKLTQNKYRSLFGEGEIEGLPVILAKPMTYMNESGKAVKALIAAFNLSPEQILVTHDDIDLPLGKIKTKVKGGDGGQLGIRSTIETLRTREFYRVRIGVDRPEDREDIVDYVLSPFNKDESGLLNDVMNKAVQTIEAALKELNKQNNTTEE
jgi:peptidyl-tRNA hydrolase, PTH1 family